MGGTEEEIPLKGSPDTRVKATVGVNGTLWECSDERGGEGHPVNRECRSSKERGERAKKRNR